MNKVYQNVDINGEDHGDISAKKHSKFYNEGKWKIFIEPLLPDDCREMTFIEFGCSAGLFLKLAKDRGFKTVVGVEMNKNECDVGEAYRKSIRYRYKIINAEITEDFDFSQLPVADVVLLSSFHYHLYFQDFLALMDHLRHTARYVIVVSDEKPSKVYWRADRRIQPVQWYFRDWKNAGFIPLIDRTGDPTPRKMYSIAFQSELERIKIDDIKGSNGEPFQWKNHIWFFMKQSGYAHNYQIYESRYYDISVKQRKKKQSVEEIRALIQKKHDLAWDMKHNGMKKPILIHPDKRLADGAHRLMMMKILGYTSIIVRTL